MIGKEFTLKFKKPYALVRVEKEEPIIDIDGEKQIQVHFHVIKSGAHYKMMRGNYVMSKQMFLELIK